MAGFKVVYANEFIAAACNTYAANKHADTIINMAPGELDVLDGCSPLRSRRDGGGCLKCVIGIGKRFYQAHNPAPAGFRDPGMGVENIGGASLRCIVSASVRPYSA